MKQRTLALCLALVMALVCVSCNSANTITPTDVTGTDVSKSDSAQGEAANGTSANEVGTSSEAGASADGATSTVGESQGTESTASNPTTASKESKPSNSTTTKPNNTVSSKPSSNKGNTSSENDEIVFEKFDMAKVEQLVAKYINEYRVAEGKPAATFLYGKTYQYVKIRAKQLTTNYAHDANDERAAATSLKFGEYTYIDPNKYDPSAIEQMKQDGLWDPTIKEYWEPIGGEAIGRQSATAVNGFTNDEHARRIAKSCYDSKGHWAYVGNANNLYISVGLAVGNGYLCDCVYVNTTNQYD